MHNNELKMYTDSVLLGKNISNTIIKNSTPLLKIGNDVYTVSDWIKYAKLNKYNIKGKEVPFLKLYDEFEKNQMNLFYKNNLEMFNDEFKQQMNEYKEGNLFFEIMQQQIWDKSNIDSVELRNLYNQNIKKYYWKPSAQVISFYASDSAIGMRLFKDVQQQPTNWKKIIELFTGTATADTFRFEWAQILGLNDNKPEVGVFTSPIINPNDQSITFNYILQVYKNEEPRSFTEAKGLVINDYQTILEQKFIEKLRKKYPVIVNKQVFDSIAK